MKREERKCRDAERERERERERDREGEGERKAEGESQESAHGEEGVSRAKILRNKIQIQTPLKHSPVNIITRSASVFR